MPLLTRQLQACDSLTQEHRYMETLLEQLEGLLPQLQDNSHDGRSSVTTLLSHIEGEMNTHFACEEKALFPAVTPYHPMVLMEVEHEELIALRDSVLALLKKSDCDDTDLAQIKTLAQQFMMDMRDHIAREDAGIFPACETSLSEDEKSDVIAGMAKIRADAATAPTPSISRPDKQTVRVQLDLESPLQRAVFSERLLNQTHLEVKHLSIQAGQAISTHWSPKSIVLTCLAGEGTFSVDGEETPLKPGLCVTLSPQMEHSVQAKTDCHFLLVFYSI